MIPPLPGHSSPDTGVGCSGLDSTPRVGSECQERKRLCCHWLVFPGLGLHRVLPFLLWDDSSHVRGKVSALRGLSDPVRPIPTERCVGRGPRAPGASTGCVSPPTLVPGVLRAYWARGQPSSSGKLEVTCCSQFLGVVSWPCGQRALRGQQGPLNCSATLTVL